MVFGNTIFGESDLFLSYTRILCNLLNCLTKASSKGGVGAEIVLKSSDKKLKKRIEEIEIKLPMVQEQA